MSAEPPFVEGDDVMVRAPYAPPGDWDNAKRGTVRRRLDPLVSGGSFVYDVEISNDLQTTLIRVPEDRVRDFNILDSRPGMNRTRA